MIVFFGMVAAERHLTVPALWAAVLCAVHLFRRYPKPRVSW